MHCIIENCEGYREKDGVVGRVGNKESIQYVVRRNMRG